jgi:hypothetical protein
VHSGERSLLCIFKQNHDRKLTFLNYPRCGLRLPMLVTARSKVWACGRLHAGIAGSNPAGEWMSVSFERCVLSGRGLCVGMITHPEESYRVWCVWVWSCILDNEAALPGPLGAVRDFRSCAGEGFIIVEYDSMAMGNRIPTFQGFVMTSCSKAE